MQILMKDCLSPLLLISVLLGCQPPPTTQQQVLTDSSASTTKASSGLPADETIYFSASGTEPFWNIALSSRAIKFTSLVEGFEQFATPPVEPVRAEDPHITRYQAQTEAGQLVVEIDSSECINAMSGAAFPYQVTVRIQPGIDQETAVFQGCGRYVPDYRLHDIWVLESMKGVPVSKEQFQRELPSMELDTRNASFMGFSGCNRMNGKLVTEREQVRFTDIFTTRKACSPGNVEGEFLTALRSATSFRIGNNRLYLSDPEEELLVFKKID